MAIRTQHEITERTWFVTFTCFNWIPLFEITLSYDLVYKWLKLIDEKYKIKTFAFVIMPNHVHLLLYLTDEKVNLNTIIGNAKRFMAYELVKRLTEKKHNSILNKLASACSLKERAKGQLHKVFEPSFDAKAIFSYPFLHQKLDYIHHNPVHGKWGLCTTFIDYTHSSAVFYELDKPHAELSITDYRHFWCQPQRRGLYRENLRRRNFILNWDLKHCRIFHLPSKNNSDLRRMNWHNKKPI